MSSLFLFVFFGFEGESVVEVVVVSAGVVVVEGVSDVESFFKPYFLIEGVVVLEEELSSGKLVEKENLGLVFGEGGAGDGSLVRSFKEGVRLRIRGVGLGGVGLELLLLSSVDESVPPPKLLAFLNLTVTVSDAADEEDDDDSLEESLVSASTSERSVVRLRWRTGVST